MARITENSLVSVGVLIAIVGGAGYITWVAFQGNANASSIEELKTDKKAMSTTLEQIAIDVAVTRSKVERIENKLNKKER